MKNRNNNHFTSSLSEDAAKKILEDIISIGDICNNITIIGKKDLSQKETRELRTILAEVIGLLDEQMGHPITTLYPDLLPDYL